MLDPHGEIVALHAVEPAVVSTVECTVVRRRDVPCPVALMHELRDLVCRLLLEKKTGSSNNIAIFLQGNSNNNAVKLNAASFFTAHTNPAAIVSADFN